MEPAAFREHLVNQHSGTELEVIGSEREAKIRSDYPWLPEDYLIFLKEVGWGCIGDSRYMIYEGPMEPSEIFDAETALGLEGVVIVGDDFAEYCEAYVRRGSGCIFGSVSKEDGTFSAHPEPRLIDFLVSWYGR